MFYNDINNLIFKELSYTDLLKLKNLGFNITDTVAHNAGVYQIKQRLTELGIDADDFCQKLWDTKCIMAGSFPLQCVLGEKWKTSDIDIYGINEKIDSNYFWKKAIYKENEENINRLCDYANFKYLPYDKIDKYSFHKPTHYPHDFEKYLWLLFMQYYTTKTHRKLLARYDDRFKRCGLNIPMAFRPIKINYTYLGIKYTRNYQLKNIQIQYIECDSKIYTKSDQALDTFDFDFCKISFDGKNIISNQKWYDIPEKKGMWISNHMAISQISNFVGEKYYKHRLYENDLVYEERFYKSFKEDEENDEDEEDEEYEYEYKKFERKRVECKCFEEDEEDYEENEEDEEDEEDDEDEYEYKKFESKRFECKCFEEDEEEEYIEESVEDKELNKFNYCQYQSLIYYYRTLQKQRLAKYEARGFNVVNLSDYEEFVEKLCSDKLNMSVSEYDQQVKKRPIKNRPIR
jgi:hypothetical protein